MVAILPHLPVGVPRRQHANQIAQIFDHIVHMVDCELRAGARGGDFLLGGAQLRDPTMIAFMLCSKNEPFKGCDVTTR
jgi:hypothetical protein